MSKLKKDGTTRKPTVRREKIEDSEIFSIDKIKRFWEYGLNPITGFPREIARKEFYHHTSFYLDKSKL
jgi:hypothetical protein